MLLCKPHYQKKKKEGRCLFVMYKYANKCKLPAVCSLNLAHLSLYDILLKHYWKLHTMSVLFNYFLAAWSFVVLLTVVYMDSTSGQGPEDKGQVKFCYHLHI